MTKRYIEGVTLPPELQTANRLSTEILSDTGTVGLVMQRDGGFWVTVTNANADYSAWDASWLPLSPAWPSTLPGTPA